MFVKQREWYSAIAILLLSSTLSAQSINIYNSNGFENPPFNGGGATLAGYNASGLPGGQGTGSQNAWSTTDLNQLIGFPAAGLVQNSLVQSGSQAVRIYGDRLFDDPTFSGGTF